MGGEVVVAGLFTVTAGGRRRQLVPGRRIAEEKNLGNWGGIEVHHKNLGTQILYQFGFRQLQGADCTIFKGVHNGWSQISNPNLVLKEHN